MIYLWCKVDYWPPPDKMCPMFKKALRKAKLTAAKYWHSQMLPEHFRPGADARYGYAPRSAKTVAQKSQRGKPPLVLDGLTKTWVMIAPKIKAAVSYVLIQLHVPSYIRQRPLPGQPDIAREIFEITGPEWKRIEKVMQWSVETDLRKRGYKHTVVIR